MTTWTDLRLDGPDEALPDLTPIVESDDAAEAVASVVAEHRETGRALAVGALSDEELFAYLASEEQVQPQGQWFSTLSQAERRIARIAALRSLTTREEVVIGSADGDGDLEARMSLRLMALLRLRREPVLLSAQGMTRHGPSWYLLRKHDDVWMREIVSEHGFHSHHLVQLDDQEEVFFRLFTALGDTQHPSTVSLRQQADVPLSLELRRFLEEQRHITQLAMVLPGEEVPESYVICVDHREAMTIGIPDGDDLRYSGDSADSVVERWRVWRDLW